MANRLKKSEYLLTYMIIITLACFVGGFFLGAGVMKSKMEAEYAQAAELEKEKERNEALKKEQRLYKESDFVSFYYNAYLPLQAFKDDHLYYAANLQGKSKTEQLALSREMKKKVAAKLKEVEKGTVPTTSPLLVESKQKYLVSLASYQEGLDRILDDVTGVSFSAADIAAQNHLSDFKNHWLLAQTTMYKAIAVWEEMYVTKRPMPKANIQTLSIPLWKSYPYHYKNYLLSDHLRKSQEVARYNPEDLAARIDSVIKANKESSLGWKDIPFAINAITLTDAVHAGDFKELRAKLYQGLKTPEIPLFTD